MAARISDELVDILGDGIDIAADALQIIPVVGIVLKTAKLAGSVPDRIFISKCQKFFSELGDISQNDIEEFKKSLGSEERTRDLGRNMLFLIDRMDDEMKPAIVGRLFRAVLEQRLSLEMMKRIGALLNLTYTPDLQRLYEFRDEHEIDADDSPVASLAAAGFLRQTGIDYGIVAEIPMGTTMSYRLNEYGQALVDFGLTPPR